MPRKTTRKKNTPDHAATCVGSPAWVAGALLRKFAAAPPGNALATAADYFALRKLQRLLWKPETPVVEYIWMDPDDFNDPSGTPDLP